MRAKVTSFSSLEGFRNGVLQVGHVTEVSGSDACSFAWTLLQFSHYQPWSQQLHRQVELRELRVVPCCADVAPSCGVPLLDGFRNWVFVLVNRVYTVLISQWSSLGLIVEEAEVVGRFAA